MRNFNETNGSSSIIERVGKKLLGSTAITAAGLMALSTNAQAADDWTGHIIDSGSTTVDISIPDETNITQHTSLVKARGDADIKSRPHCLILRNQALALAMFFLIQNWIPHLFTVT